MIEAAGNGNSQCNLTWHTGGIHYRVIERAAVSEMGHCGESKVSIKKKREVP